MNRKLMMMTIGAGLCALGSHVVTPVEAAPICVWRGTAPLCAGECEQGETKATTNPRNFGVFVPAGGRVVGDYGEVCVTGSKALCCKEEFPEFIAWCSRYADDAVEHAKKNLELICGLHKENAALWTDNRDAHLNECLSHDGAYAEPTKKALSRVAALKKCTAVIQGPGKSGDIIKATPPPVGDAGTGPAPTSPAQPPAGGQTATVIADVDVYQLVGGGGEQLGILYSNNSTTKVSLVEPCQNNWFHVKGDAVPKGQGWVYSGKGGDDYKSLDLEPCQ
jgi:hypothetical protein